MKYLSNLKNKIFSNETCLLRVDFNVQDADLRGLERESTQIPLRLEAILPTIRFLLKRRAKIVLLSHRGRPLINLRLKTKNLKLRKREFSLKFAVDFLARRLKRKIVFINNFNFTSIKNKIKNSSPGTIFLLENLRFLPGEEKNDAKLAKQLASLGTFYVNDAFAVSHRKNASVVAITKFLPSYAGLLLEEEIKNLNRIIKNPRQPLVLILGGAKISDKIGLIKKFLTKAKYILIGGGLANTMFRAQGMDIGESLFEPEMLRFAKSLLHYKNIILPNDWIVYQNKILDIGPLTVEQFKKIIKKAKTIIWNGPMGYFEDKRFTKGTHAIVKIVAKSRALSIVGGGETVTAFQAVTRNFAEKVRVSPRLFLSTAGGAMLEYLADKKLPGINALESKKQNFVF